MGGDKAPRDVVRGAVEAAEEYGLTVILVGDSGIIERELDEMGLPRNRVDICHCTEVAEMDESPAMVLRRKKDASIRVAFELVKSGEAQAVVSAGNSGATLAVGSYVLGRMSGVDRSGIAGIFPTLKGYSVVIDIGANVDCKPIFLYQFGIMASAYVSEIFNLENPRVGLLSIGEEDNKGNDLVRKAHEFFKGGDLNFIGNVEGRDVFAGSVDVIVCDGFVGNVVLKLAEGAAEVIAMMLKSELTAGFWSRLGAFFSQGAYRRFRKKVDYAETGGAPLLGIKGVAIISHGASSPRAIKNAIRTANDMVVLDLTSRLEARIRSAPNL